MITSELISEHLLWSTIRRPASRNAINYQVIDDLEQQIERVEQDESIRVFVLTGEGTAAFVAGGDLREFHSITSTEEALRMSKRMHALFSRIERLNCWTLCYINGDAYGGGVELMLAFDFRLARQGIKLGFTQSRFYLTPGWGGLTRLVEKVGRARALEWLAKASVIEAEQALEEKVIEGILRTESPSDEVKEWVQKLTYNDRKYIKALKSRSFIDSEDRNRALESEIQPFAELWVDEEHQRRVADFISKTK